MVKWGPIVGRAGLRRGRRRHAAMMNHSTPEVKPMSALSDPGTWKGAPSP